jgi:hypothetical protein
MVHEFLKSKTICGLSDWRFETLDEYTVRVTGQRQLKYLAPKHINLYRKESFKRFEPTLRWAQGGLIPVGKGAHYHYQCSIIVEK